MSQPDVQAIVIGASAGAIETLCELLPALPESFSIPVFIVVHIPPDKESLMPQIFGERCKVAVKEAEDKEPIRSGTIYFAPPNYHLLLERNGSLSLSGEEPELFSRPSINILFESAAKAYGPKSMGIILTGANNDGSRGLKAVEAAGGLAITQDPQDAHDPIMPLSAFKACQHAQQMTIAQLTAYLQKMAAFKGNY